MTNSNVARKRLDSYNEMRQKFASSMGTSTVPASKMASQLVSPRATRPPSVSANSTLQENGVMALRSMPLFPALPVPSAPVVLRQPEMAMFQPVAVVPSMASIPLLSPRQDSFLLHWFLALVGLWLSLFVWTASLVGITVNWVQQRQVDTNNNSSELSTLSTASNGVSIPGVMDVSPMSEGEEERAKLARNRLERYCRETKRQLGENEVKLPAKDRRRVENKCDYVLQWLARNPNAPTEDYIRGLDDVATYCERLINRGDGRCSVL